MTSRSRIDDARVAGALFDFVGFLTTRDESVTLGASHNAQPAADAIQAFAAARGLSLDDAAVESWNAPAVAGSSSVRDAADQFLSSPRFLSLDESARDVTLRARGARAALAMLGALVFECCHRNAGNGPFSLDALDLRELAVVAGAVRKEATRVPCDPEGCPCAENDLAGLGETVDCYRFVPAVVSLAEMLVKLSESPEWRANRQ